MMAWEHEELRRLRKVYDAAVQRWYKARDEKNIVEEDRFEERAAGVRWRAMDGVGRAALGAFQIAKSELDAMAYRVQRLAGDESCPQCDKVKRPPPPGPPRLESVPMDLIASLAEEKAFE